MQLVADVRHRRLVDDPAVLGVDDRQEVRLLDPRALVQAGEVEELLRRRLQGLGRGGVERLRLVVTVLMGLPSGHPRVARSVYCRLVATIAQPAYAPVTRD